NRGDGAFPHPRLATVQNGWGGKAVFTYGNDGRSSTSSWYNWRVSQLDIQDGLTANGATDMRTVFAYVTPCYNDKPVNGGGLGWCNGSSVGDLVGYAQTTVTTQDPTNANAPLAVVVHKFHTDEQRSGQEYETQNKDASGATILSKTLTTHTVMTNGLPPKTYFPYVQAQESYVLQGGALILANRSEYGYDPAAGNLTSQKNFNSAAPNSQFANSFETNNLTGWSSSVTNSGSLAATAVARLSGDYGLKATVSSSGTAYLEQGGEVVIEADHYAGTAPGSGNAAGHTWQFITTPTGYTGAGAMQALPNSGVNTGLNTNGPALTYNIYFQNPGAYYVFVRGKGNNPNVGDDDSIHVGLDGVSVTSDAGIGLTHWTDPYSWQNRHNGGPTSINVTTAGLHTFYLWMRQDGVIIDKIWLSTNPAEVGSNNTSAGDPESAQGGGGVQYVEDASPTSLSQYSAQFYFDPNSVTMTGGLAVLFDARSGGNSQFQVQMQKSGGNYQLQLQARDNNGMWRPTTAVWKTIADSAHIIDVQWT
ncbi:MAG: hypothetical protein AAB658_14770, partial [Chloroflexota bacterium]